MLLLVALLAGVASATLQAGAALGRRDAEQELLAIGQEFHEALRTYAHLPPGAGVTLGARGPRTLDELLRDPRLPGVRRHLRQLRADPLTGKPAWGLVRDRDGFIVGIHSLAQGRPIKQAGFDPAMAHLEGAGSYAEWVFGLAPARTTARH